MRSDKQLKLHVMRDGRLRTVARYESSGTVYEPISIDSTTLAAIRFPTRSAGYGSVAKLFARILTALTELTGLPSGELQLVPYWILSTWFPDALPILPTLAVSGPSAADARRFLRILRCFCRRGVLVTAVTPGSLLKMRTQLRPTLLVHHGKLARSVGDLLQAGSLSGSYIPRRGEFLDLRSSTAIYCEEDDLGSDIAKSSLKVSLFPAARALTVFDEREEEQVSAEFQAQLLRYRLERFQVVRNSNFDAPAFTTEVRDLVRALAACVAAEPTLISDLTSLLAAADEDVRSGWSTRPEFAIVTALIALVHEKKESRVAVTELTQFVNVALRTGGELKEYSPVEIGRLLSRLDIPRFRGAGGRVIPITRDLSRRVHCLGRRYGGTISPGAYPGCPDCTSSGRSSGLPLVQGVHDVHDV